MPILRYFLTVPTSLDACFGHAAALRPTPPARAERPVADDAHDVRVERRIDAVDTNRPDYDVVPEHDSDGTWGHAA